MNWMGPFSDDNKFQVEEKNNKNWKVWKIFENFVNQKVYDYSL